MKALTLFAVSVVLSLGMVLANPDTLSGAQNPADGNWKTPAAWNKIKPGMSERQVISILGTPTKSQDSPAGTWKTLFYQGEVEGSGYVSGNVDVNRRDDRVIAVNRPVF